MSDETTQTEAERDAAVIADYRTMVDYYASVGQPGGYVMTGPHLHKAHAFDAAALRTIDRLTMWKTRLIEVFVECMNDIDFGQSGDDATDIIYHIRSLRQERDRLLALVADVHAMAAEDIRTDIAPDSSSIWSIEAVTRGALGLPNDFDESLLPVTPRQQLAKLVAENGKLRGWMAGYALMREEYAKEYLAHGKPDKSEICTIVAHDIVDALNAIRAALGEPGATE